MSNGEKFDFREAVHEAARGASIRGSCNVLACAFDDRATRAPRCSMYCDEQVEALRRAYAAGRSAALREAARAARELADTYGNREHDDWSEGATEGAEHVASAIERLGGVSTEEGKP